MTDENSYPPSKKRAAGREISRDNPGLDDEDEDVSELESGTFKRASEEVIATRKIVKVRRQPTASAPSAPTSNPFAGIRLAPPVSTATTDVSNNELKAQAQVEDKVADKEDVKDKQDKETNEEDKLDQNELAEKTEKIENAAVEGNLVNKNESADVPAETNDQKANSSGKDEPKTSDVNDTVNGDEKGNAEGNAFSSFQQLSSSKNAFTGLAGPGFSPSAFSFGLIPKEGSPSGTGFAFGSSAEQSSLPSFSFTSPNNGSGSLFGSIGASGNKTEGAAAFPSMQEVSVETGEENEQTVFTADSALFEYSEGGWKERGKGEVKLNRSTSGTQKARLVMRARGNYRLILNAYLYPDMKLTKMDKKGITFACANSAAEGKTGLTTFALKFKEVSIVETFTASVAAHKGDEIATPAPGLNTPENSPKAAEE